MPFTTADSNERLSINTVRGKPVYLLQPNGAPAIEENNFDGSCIIGGMDIYEWLATMNVTHLKESVSESEFRRFGVSLFYDGEVTFDGECYECMYPIKLSFNKHAVYEDIKEKTVYIELYIF